MTTSATATPETRYGKKNATEINPLNLGILFISKAIARELINTVGMKIAITLYVAKKAAWTLGLLSASIKFAKPTKSLWGEMRFQLLNNRTIPQIRGMMKKIKVKMR